MLLLIVLKTCYYGIDEAAGSIAEGLEHSNVLIGILIGIHPLFLIPSGIYNNAP